MNSGTTIYAPTSSATNSRIAGRSSSNYVSATYCYCNDGVIMNSSRSGNGRCYMAMGSSDYFDLITEDNRMYGTIKCGGGSVYNLFSVDKVSGAWKANFTGTLQANSSRLEKYNIIHLTPNYLNILDQLQVVNFKYINENNTMFHTGLIYEDTQTILPEICYNTNGIKSINYEMLIPLLVLGVQDLHLRLSNLEQEK